ncbi:MAG TPA: aspartate aminotransferase family protein [Dehalococcoidia bacterium]|jgi:adenosylmethionine-8-amino-7-oxononanoate aminotransferase|nr:aspartate aminotransferase family protein [SAR202 cluster bacterium]HAL46791.1 aspartate aminotransferase family protein [Dehalococcoidia bacterium]
MVDTDQIRRSALDHLWMNNRDWVQMAEEGGPQVIVEGDGIRVTDTDGREWIDANGGYASVNVGYGRTEIAEAMREQMSRLIYFPQGSTTEPLVNLAAKLAEITPGNLERSWPVTGGSEANETAIKIARAYHKRRGEGGRYKIISRRGSYHGALGAVMWAGGGGMREDYEPEYPGMLLAPQPNPYRCEKGGATPSECAVRCAQAIEDMIQFHGPSTVAAVLAEPVSASSAAVVPGDEYWPLVRQICDRYGVLLIADEVINGFGRTGKMFASEHWGVVPDIMTMAKGLTSSYLPVANAIVTTGVADAFAGEDSVFKQSLTFGGHPVTAAAALKNIEIIESENLVGNSARVGAYFLEQLESLQSDHPMIGDVRGIGLLLGIELVQDRDTKMPYPQEAGVGPRLDHALHDQGLILRSAGGRTISMGPPLCMTESDADEVTARLDRAIGIVEKGLQTP